MSASLPVITVDPEQVRELAAALAGVCADLRNSARLAPDVGEPHITAALHDVQRDWSHARDAICEFLDAAGASLRSAADGYDDLEQAICRAAR